MAEVKVNKSPEQQQSERRGLLARRGELFPFWRSSDLMNPFGLMRRLSEEMDRAFGRWGDWEEGTSVWMPAIEVTEREGNLVVRADLPGIKKEDVKIEMTPEALIIRGERKQEHEEKKEGYYRSERTYGQFNRSIPLPEGADLDKAKAEFKDGVLEVAVPVPETQARRREIPIR
jgi:HSP20 family protein